MDTNEDKELRVLIRTSFILGGFLLILLILVFIRASHRNAAVRDIGKNEVCVQVDNINRPSTSSSKSTSRTKQSNNKTATDTEIDSDILSFLSMVYPSYYDNKTHNYRDPIEDVSTIMTARCSKYHSMEMEYCVVYQTQDGYTGIDSPNPTFTKYNGVPNAYKVTWMSSKTERKKVILVLVKSNGKVLIDNFVDESNNRLYFDYSKPAESIWD